jgi:osmotically-inducible protein OsmY
VDAWLIYDYPWYEAPVITTRSDREIQRNIDSELLWSPFVDADDVKVTVEAGVATLTGSVDSLSEYNAARENAFEGGAVTVVNKLELE